MKTKLLPIVRNPHVDNDRLYAFQQGLKRDLCHIINAKCGELKIEHSELAGLAGLPVGFVKFYLSDPDTRNYLSANLMFMVTLAEAVGVTVALVAK